ncbi:hypothetical protein COOONC_26353 [Cooperia oncophora]
MKSGQSLVYKDAPIRSLFEDEIPAIVASERNKSLKEIVSERDSKLDALRVALDEEQERRQRDHQSWKMDLTAAQNVRMAEVVSDLASNENKVVRSAGAHLTNVAQVQTMSPMAKVKSRDAQTDLTRTFLAQMECDAVSYSSEMKALRAAYTELREAVGQLVCKEHRTLRSGHWCQSPLILE